MTKITQEKFLEMIKQDQKMAKRLANYLGDTKDEKEIALKVQQFAKKEGYELEAQKTELDINEIGAVSGGRGSWLDLGKSVWNWFNASSDGHSAGNGDSSPGYFQANDGKFYSEDGNWVWDDDSSQWLKR